MSPGKRRKRRKGASPLPARRGSGRGKSWQRHRSYSSSPVQQRNVASAPGDGEYHQPNDGQANSSLQSTREMEGNTESKSAAPSPVGTDAVKVQSGNQSRESVESVAQ